MQLNKSAPLKKKTHKPEESLGICITVPCSPVLSSLFHSMLYTVIIRRPNETTGLPGLRTLLQVMNDSRRRTNERGYFLDYAGSPSITPGGVSASMCVKIRWRTWQHQKEYISAVKYRLAVYHLPSDQRKLV
jgi:hypothetical protein